MFNPANEEIVSADTLEDEGEIEYYNGDEADEAEMNEEDDEHECQYIAEDEDEDSGDEDEDGGEEATSEGAMVMAEAGMRARVHESREEEEGVRRAGGVKAGERRERGRGVQRADSRSYPGGKGAGPRAR